MKVEIDFSKVTDWNTFHELFKHEMGFPDFYGGNGDAWIDCMSYIDDPDSGMSKITVKENESLEIIAVNIEDATANAPDVVLGFVELVAIVNQRFVDSGSSTRLLINAT